MINLRDVSYVSTILSIVVETSVGAAQIGPNPGGIR